MDAVAAARARNALSQSLAKCLRAEAAYNFSDTFMTELAPVPNGEFIGANMKTEALRQLLVTV